MGVCPSESEQGVMIPAVNVASSTTALRSLGKRAIHTVAISEYETPPSFCSKYCNEVINVPDPKRDLAAYEETLLELSQRQDIRTILPFRESDIYVLARNKRTFANHIGTPWPSLDTLKNVQDRIRLFDVANTANVARPMTKSLTEWNDSDQNCVVKPRYTVHAPEYSRQFGETHTQWSSTLYFSADDELDRDELIAEIGHVPIVQEYIPTRDEYALFALYEHGEPVATFQHRQRRGMRYCGGASTYRESVDIPELKTAGLRLLDELDWHGVAMVEFLRDPDTGTFKLMEVNPRFWSSLPFTVQAGVDFPHLYWRQAIGDRIEITPEYEVGVAGHLLRGELIHLYSILADDYPLVERPSFTKTVFDVMISVVRDPRFDYLDMDDLSPFVCDFRNMVLQLSSTR